MRYLINLVVVSLFGLPASGEPQRALLALEATPARVELAASTGERRTINLPSLQFPVRIEPTCPAGSALTSVSINVADARFRYTPDDFAGKASLDATIVVPAPQIAPLTIEHSCPAESAAGDTGLVIPDVLTAHASLRCADDNGEQVLFEVIGLGVELRCRQPEEAAWLRTRR